MNGVLSMVESLRSVPSVPLLAAGPQQYLLFGLTNGHSSPSTETAVLAEEDPAVPAKDTIDSLVRPLVESAKATPPAPNAKFTELKVPDEPSAIPVTAPPDPPTFVELAAPPNPPEVIAPLIERRTPAAQPPASAPLPAARPNPFLSRVAQIAELRIPARSPAAASPVQSASLPTAEPPATALPTRTEPVTLPVPALKFMELAVPPNPPAKTAPRLEPTKPASAQPASRPAAYNAEPVRFPRPTLRIAGHASPAAPAARVAPLTRAAWPTAKRLASAALRISESAGFPATKPQFPGVMVVAEPFGAAAAFARQGGVLYRALELQAEAVLDEIKSGLDAYELKIQAIVATFQIRPKLALLPPPSDIVVAPAPPDLQWLKVPRPALPARKPSDRKCDTLTATPQKLPLAGPCLPPELENYMKARPVERSRSRKGIGLPTWIISLVIATSVFLVVAVVLQFLAANREMKAAVVPGPSQAVAAAPAAPAFEQHPFARFVEVTGLRVVADLNHRSQVQYIVVNHSATQLSGMMIRVAVRSSADPAGSAPLFTVSAVVPSLGPHQSKEIRTDLDSELRSSAIPDWEYLRPEVHVGTQN